MRVLVLVVVAIAACGGDERELPDAGAPVDALPFDARTGLPDDGFGFWCNPVYDPNNLNTPCTASSGLAGFCDGETHRCLRRCDGERGAYPRSCPHHQAVVYIIGLECVCDPVDCWPGTAICRPPDLAP